ncbi:stAR-related lipid transfer protein 9 [Gastrophryne carolinensis]
MANVRVALRVRPLSKRENSEEAKVILSVDDKIARIRNVKLDYRADGCGDARERFLEFGFDYCYWSVDPEDPKYASQEVIFQDLGTTILSEAINGYNVCLFAYGQTGSGKTYTMMGTPASVGLTPRICEGLFSYSEDSPETLSSSRIEVSFLEIYNERARDLLHHSNQKKPYTLRVREHPEKGPYVQGLSRHLVTNYEQVVALLEEGIENRITAATHVHDASSRSHAIFTIQYTQAMLEDNLPSETASKINLVDLAGSERASPNYCKDRLTEGSNINRSLVTLGIVISALAQNSQMNSSCQSINSISSDGDTSMQGSSPVGSSNSGSKRQPFVPYRDSILTWLLKDSLGGNSKTIMIATVSPASSSYNESISTLRYASNAKNIINRPRVNEDGNVKLIRELREEINRLKAMIRNFEMRTISPSFSEERDGNLTELVLQNELKIEQLTKDWTDKWTDKAAIMEQYNVDINQGKARLTIDSGLPHLIAMDDDILSTGVVIYHLKEGTTNLGSGDHDIVLQGECIKQDHCIIENSFGVVELHPGSGAFCSVNGQEITDVCRLTQGAVIVLGKSHRFRFNHPAEAALLRQKRADSLSSFLMDCSLDWLDLSGDNSSKESSHIFTTRSTETLSEDLEVSCQKKIEQQQRYVEELKAQINAAQVKGEKELQQEQSLLNQKIQENELWLVKEKQRLTTVCEQRKESASQTDVKTYAEVEVQNCVQTEFQPSLEELERKRLVQLELLNKCSLRRAERNISRKRVKFQIEKIVKKQKLLEAKKTLQKLQAVSWVNDDALKQSNSPVSPVRSASPERTQSGHSLLSYYRRRSLPCTLRTFPTYSALVKRKNKYELLHKPRENRKPVRAVSIECLLKTSPTPVGSKPYIVGTTSPQAEKRTIEVLLSQSKTASLLPSDSKMSKKRQKMDKANGRVPFKNCPTELPKKRNAQSPLYPASKDSKLNVASSPSQTTSGVLRSNTISEKNKPNLKNNAVKTSQETNTKHARKVNRQEIKQCGESSSSKKSKGLSFSSSDSKLKLSNPINISSSVDNISKHSNALVNSCSADKRWMSTERLNTGDTRSNSTTTHTLEQWTEHANDSSDGESFYSIDSLSSAYSSALNEHIKQNEKRKGKKYVWNESDSEDSQMSRDSLGDWEESEQRHNKQRYNRYKKSVTHSRASKSLTEDHKSFPLVTAGLVTTGLSKSFSLDSLADTNEVTDNDSSEELPAELFWKLQSPRSLIMNDCQKNADIIAMEESTDLERSSSFYLKMNDKANTTGNYSEERQEIFPATYVSDVKCLQYPPCSFVCDHISLTDFSSKESTIEPFADSGKQDASSPNPVKIFDCHFMKAEVNKPNESSNDNPPTSPKQLHKNVKMLSANDPNTNPSKMEQFENNKPIFQLTDATDSLDPNSNKNHTSKVYLDYPILSIDFMDSKVPQRSTFEADKRMDDAFGNKSSSLDQMLNKISNKKVSLSVKVCTDDEIKNPKEDKDTHDYERAILTQEETFKYLPNRNKGDKGNHVEKVKPNCNENDSISLNSEILKKSRSTIDLQTSKQDMGKTIDNQPASFNKASNICQFEQEGKCEKNKVHVPPVALENSKTHSYNSAANSFDQNENVTQAISAYLHQSCLDNQTQMQIFSASENKAGLVLKPEDQINLNNVKSDSFMSPITMSAVEQHFDCKLEAQHGLPPDKCHVTNNVTNIAETTQTLNGLGETAVVRNIGSTASVIRSSVENKLCVLDNEQNETTDLTKKLLCSNLPQQTGNHATNIYSSSTTDVFPDVFSGESSNDSKNVCYSGFVCFNTDTLPKIDMDTRISFPVVSFTDLHSTEHLPSLSFSSHDKAKQGSFKFCDNNMNECFSEQDLHLHQLETSQSLTEGSKTPELNTFDSTLSSYIQKAVNLPSASSNFSATSDYKPPTINYVKCDLSDDFEKNDRPLPSLYNTKCSLSSKLLNKTFVEAETIQNENIHDSNYPLEESSAFTMETKKLFCLETSMGSQKFSKVVSEPPHSTHFFSNAKTGKNIFNPQSKPFEQVCQPECCVQRHTTIHPQTLIPHGKKYFSSDTYLVVPKNTDLPFCNERHENAEHYRDQYDAQKSDELKANIINQDNYQEITKQDALEETLDQARRLHDYGTLDSSCQTCFGASRTGNGSKTQNETGFSYHCVNWTHKNNSLETSTQNVGATGQIILYYEANMQSNIVSEAKCCGANSQSTHFENIASKQDHVDNFCGIKGMLEREEYTENHENENVMMQKELKKPPDKMQKVYESFAKDSLKDQNMVISSENIESSFCEPDVSYTNAYSLQAAALCVKSPTFSQKLAQENKSNYISKSQVELYHSQEENAETKMSSFFQASCCRPSVEAATVDKSKIEYSLGCKHETATFYANERDDTLQSALQLPTKELCRTVRHPAIDFLPTNEAHNDLSVEMGNDKGNEPMEKMISKAGSGNYFIELDKSDTTSSEDDSKTSSSLVSSDCTIKKLKFLENIPVVECETDMPETVQRVPVNVSQCAYSSKAMSPKCNQDLWSKHECFSDAKASDEPESSKQSIEITPPIGSEIFPEKTSSCGRPVCTPDCLNPEFDPSLAGIDCHISYDNDWSLKTQENAAEHLPEGIDSKTFTTELPSKLHSSLFCGTSQQTQTLIEEMVDNAEGLHFQSSDINPFVHSWQQEVSPGLGWRNCSFNSASDVSSTKLQVTSDKLLRCSSVDEGLNSHNSPFNSHLSSYANSKPISSTVSSFGENYSRPDLNSLNGSQGHLLNDSADALIKIDLNETSGSQVKFEDYLQLDEIMILYTSESETGNETDQKISQALDTQTKPRHRRTTRHQRSHTDVSNLKQMRSQNFYHKPGSWSSVHNMSVHLSQLLQETSELLGNLSQHHHENVCPNDSRLQKKASDSIIQKLVRDTSTQTSEDKGVQTDKLTLNNPQNHTTESSSFLTPSEINVIVKVIGAESLTQIKHNTLPEKANEVHAPKIRTQSLPNLQEHTPCKLAEHEMSKSPEVLASAPLLHFSNMSTRSLPLSTPRYSPISATVKDSENMYSSVEDSPLSSLLHSVKWQDTSQGNTLLVDRATSPILTLKASKKSLKKIVPEDGFDNQYFVNVSKHKKTRGQIFNDSETTTDNESTTSYCKINVENEYEGLHSSSLRESSKGRTAANKLQRYRSEGSILQDKHSSFVKQSSSNSEISEFGKKCEKEAFSASWIPGARSTWGHPQSLGNISHLSQLILRDQKKDFGGNENEHDSGTITSSNPYIRNKIFPHTPSQDLNLQEDCLSVVESECNTDILLGQEPTSEDCQKSENYRLQDLPFHNKFTNWSGVRNGSTSSLQMVRSFTDLSIKQSPSKMDISQKKRSREIEWLQRERAEVMSAVHLELNPQPLTVQLAEAKLSYGIGETDALLKVIETGKIQSQDAVPIKKQLYERHMKVIENLRKEREQKLQSFRRSRSLSPQKQLSASQTSLSSVRECDLPSHRRKYLQQLRRDVVDSTRIHDPQKGTLQCPTEIEAMLKDYQKAREEAKTEIARARDKLRERAELEKRRLLKSTLPKEDTKIKTLASTSTLFTSSSLSLSSSPTSGYNSGMTATPAKSDRFTCQEPKILQIGSVGGCSAVRKSHHLVASQKSLVPDPNLNHQPAEEDSSVQESTKSVSRLSSTPVLYKELAIQVQVGAMAEVMAACSFDTRNLFKGKAAAGWIYQTTEKDVFVYYKAFASSTKHGFIGAGVIKRPLHDVWCIVKDVNKRRLYDQTIVTACERISADIQLVHVVMDTSVCYLKQPRDFCCICVESKEDKCYSLCFQSMYSESMPRPKKNVVRGEMLPSAWILQPDCINGEMVTIVLYMVQVDLGAPAISPGCSM